jgi:hypothetical protein
MPACALVCARACDANCTASALGPVAIGFHGGCCVVMLCLKLPEVFRRLLGVCQYTCLLTIWHMLVHVALIALLLLWGLWLSISTVGARYVFMLYMKRLDAYGCLPVHMAACALVYALAMIIGGNCTAPALFSDASCCPAVRKRVVTPGSMKPRRRTLPDCILPSSCFSVYARAQNVYLHSTDALQRLTLTAPAPALCCCCCCICALQC